MRLSRRPRTLLRNAVVALCTTVLFVALSETQRADSSPAADDLKRIDSAAAIYPQLNENALQQFAPKAAKLKKSTHFGRPANSTTKSRLIREKKSAIQNDSLPGVLSPENDRQALLLLDRPPPSESLQRPSPIDL